MTEQEKVFFKKIEEESEKNPMVRIQAASDYLNGFLKQAFTDQKGIQVGPWCYLISTMTGVSAAVAARETEQILLIQNQNNPGYMVRTKLDTTTGAFWIGDSVNRYIYNDALSVWNIVMTIYHEKHNDAALPELSAMIEQNAKKMGDPAARVWAGTNNPYEERENAKRAYENLRKNMQLYQLKENEYPIVFAMSLANVILFSEGTFPKNLNCLQATMETMMFYAHMDF